MVQCFIARGRYLSTHGGNQIVTAGTKVFETTITIQYNTILFNVESMRSGCPVSRARGSCLKCKFERFWKTSSKTSTLYRYTHYCLPQSYIFRKIRSTVRALLIAFSMFFCVCACLWFFRSRVFVFLSVFNILTQQAPDNQFSMRLTSC